MALVLKDDAGQRVGRQILQDAVNTFRQRLTDAERRNFDEQQHLNPPESDAKTVMALMMKIDERNEKKFSRCIAPKLQSFLEVVRQFTNIVDTFAAFTPPIAQLVWASVKTTLTILSGFSEYFEKLATLFHSVGESCPRFQDFGSLYETSNGLQNAICLYFAEVVGMCGKALILSRQPGIVVFLKTTFKPFDRDFGEVQGKLSRYASQINEEVTLASHKLQVQEERLDSLERQQNQSFRHKMGVWSAENVKELADIRQWQMQVQKHRDETSRRHIKENLCIIDPDAAWRQARKQCLASTAEWYQRNTVFLDWIGQDSSSVLAYLANLGGGKTIVSSNVVAHLKLQSPPSTQVAYFFCQNETAASLHARNIMGGICRQLLARLIDSAEGNELEDFLHQSSSPDIDDIVRLITTYQLPNLTSYIVIDGLDECDPISFDAVLHSLSDLVKSSRNVHNIKIFLSCRPDNIRKLELFLGSCHRLSSTATQVAHDLDLYIEATLRKKLELGQLNLSTSEHIITIQDALLTGAQGMFLWAYLLIEDLCSHNSDEAILAALRNIPAKLSELFDRLLLKLTSDELNRDLSKKLLEWATAARRVLIMDEIREAVTIRIGQKMLDVAALPNDLFRSVNACCGLLCIDEDDSTVRIVHPSLKQHLLSAKQNLAREPWLSNAVALEKELAGLCITYLGFSDFTKTMVKVTPPAPAVKPTDIARDAVGLGKNRYRKAEKAIALLRTRLSGTSGAETENIVLRAQETLSKLAMKSGAAASPHGPLTFIHYARSEWIHHAAHLVRGGNERIWDGFCHLVKSDDSHIERPWLSSRIAEDISRSLKFFTQPVSAQPAFQALAWASQNNNLALMDCQSYVILKQLAAPMSTKDQQISPDLDLVQSIITDLKQMLPGDLSDFTQAACDRMVDLLVLYQVPQGDLNFAKVLLAIFYGGTPGSDWVKGMDFEEKRQLSQNWWQNWSHGWLSLCGYKVSWPSDTGLPKRTRAAICHGVGALKVTKAFDHPACLLVALAIAMERDDILTVLVDGLRERAPWALLSAMELAIAFRQNSKALFLWTAAEHGLYRHDGHPAFNPSRLTGLALQHGMPELANLVAATVKYPNAGFDASNNSILKYACEYRATDVFARLLCAQPRNSTLDSDLRLYIGECLEECHDGSKASTESTRDAEILMKMLQMSVEEAWGIIGLRKPRRPSASRSLLVGIVVFPPLLTYVMFGGFLGSITVIFLTLGYMLVCACVSLLISRILTRIRNFKKAVLDSTGMTLIGI